MPGVWFLRGRWSRRADVTPCVSGIRTPLVQSPEITIFNIDIKGIMRSNDAGKIFDNCTVPAQGVNVIEGKKLTVYTHMKYLAPDGDYVIFRYTQNPGETSAPTTIIMGTGKWKGIPGGGKATLITQDKPVTADSFQFCNRHTGKITLP